jgi:predicted DNA-binding transcriptional regulator YafY
LEIDTEAKEYFLRKNTLANYTILEETQESLTVQTKVTFEDEILNLVRYWIPYIRIKSPTHLQEKLNSILEKYIQNTKLNLC